VAASARIAPTAQLIGDVRVGEECVIDYGCVIASSGPPVVLGAGTVVMANAVIRSVGGTHRPPFPVSIGEAVLVGPLAAIAGCRVEDAVYIATGAMVFQAASRLGAGSIVHVGARVASRSRIGMKQYAIARHGGDALITSDLGVARDLLAKADFFEQVFGDDETDLDVLHRSSVATLRAEAGDWADLQPRG